MKLEFKILDETIDRSLFQSNVEPLDTFFKQMANQQQKKGFNKTYVLIDVDGDPARALGFYTLSTGSIGLNSLPPEITRKLPKHPVPVAIIGRLAVDASKRNLGLGKFLLVDALARVKTISKSIGIFAVVVDAKNEEAEKFYLKFGFQSFLDIPRKLWINIQAIP